ncbi:Uncharacterised protein [Mycobacteroides abscessus subsp. abscessus]|nr:Uncharacterised protein [Mycobacteroides abscessus subsp. abscessus]
MRIDQIEPVDSIEVLNVERDHAVLFGTDSDPEPEVVRTRTAAGGCGSCGRSRSCLDGTGGSRSAFHRFFDFGLGFGIAVRSEQHRMITLDVEHLDGAVAVFGQLQRVVGQPGDRRRRLHAHLDEALHAKTARGLLREQQILGLDPPHRARELPCQ